MVHMDGTAHNSQKIIKRSPALSISRRRPKKRWIDDVKKDQTIMGTKLWRRLCTESSEWRKIIEQAET